MPKFIDLTGQKFGRLTVVIICKKILIDRIWNYLFKCYKS